MSYEAMYEAAEKEGSLESLTPKFMEFKELGDKVIGAYKCTNEVQSSQNQGTYNQYIFDTDIGLVKFHLGKATDQEAGRLFQENEIYKIEYKGSQKLHGGKSVNKFDIQHIVSVLRDVNTKEVEAEQSKTMPF